MATSPQKRAQRRTENIEPFSASFSKSSSYLFSPDGLLADGKVIALRCLALFPGSLVCQKPHRPNQ